MEAHKRDSHDAVIDIDQSGLGHTDISYKVPPRDHRIVPMDVVFPAQLQVLRGWGGLLAYLYLMEAQNKVLYLLVRKGCCLSTSN
jgi:hypothetical protein